MNLIFTSLLTILLSVGLYFADTKTKFGKLKYKLKQVIIGILFGISTCLATEFGQQIPNAVLNVRDAAPICAGLLFGGPAGIISGLIGGVHRAFWGTTLANTFTAEWMNTMFTIGSAGGFTRVACSLGTFCSGLLAAAARKRLFDDKRPEWFHGLAIGLAAESFHMFLAFIFRLNHLSTVYGVIKVCAVPMIAINAAAVAIAIFCVSLAARDERIPFSERKDISSVFQLWLAGCMALCFIATLIGMSEIQYKLGLKQTESMLQKNLNDISEKIELDGGLDNFIENDFTWHVGNSGGIIIAKCQYDMDGELDFLSIILNGEEYNKGSLIPAVQLTGEHVRKTADNFFKSSIRVGGVETPVYGMYLPYDNDRLIISYVPIEEATLYQGVTVYVTIIFEILVFVVMFLQIYNLVKKSVLNNMHSVNETLAKITSGNLNAVVDVRYPSEFASLSADINKTVSALKLYIADTAARINKDLEFATAIQHSALPRVIPPYSNSSDFDIYARMDTAKEVGGDFYDFFFVDDSTLAFLIADVSGKGIPAAMFMMTAKTFIKSYTESGLDAYEVFTLANGKLCASNDAGMFVTAFMGILDLKTGVVSFANAGHNPPLICRKDGDFEYFKTRAGFVLAGMDGVLYRPGTFKLEPGDTLFLYTDGVTEATDCDNKLYGEDRLVEILNIGKELNMKQLCRHVKDDVDRFVGKADQFDDITMLSIKYLGDQGI